MAEIILAEYRGNTMMVGGEEFIDDFLANTLPPNVSTRIVACESDSEFQALWAENSGKVPGARPWIIHPAIVARARGVRPGLHIVFGPWSALLDDKARAVIREAVTESDKNPDTPVSLLCHVNAGTPKPMADLSNLRRGLIEAELTGLGVDGSRIVHGTRGSETDSAEKAECDRIEITFKVG